MNEQNVSEPAPSGSVGLEVAGEDGVFWCARHRKTKTRLRCGRCETPICPKCTVYAPTGARCRNCASFRGSHLYQASVKQLAITFVAALVLGAIGAVAVRIGLFLMVLFAPALGGLLGPLLTRITGAKRGPKVAGAAAAGVACGVLGVAAPHNIVLLQSGAGLGLLFGFSNLLLLAFLVLAVVGVWFWLR